VKFVSFNQKRATHLFKMLAKQFLVAVSGMVFVSAQVPPPTGILSTVLSGVLPVLPTETPFTGLETIEGAIVNDGPVVVGFTGEVPLFLGCSWRDAILHSNNHALLSQIPIQIILYD
jgi:hypothetical protein